MKKIITILFIILNMGMAFAQELELEKTFEISRKSKRGLLSNVDYDADAKKYTLTYITKQTERKLKYEFYKFDSDFNFLEDGEGEEKFETMKTKFKWFKFRDLLYSVEGITVSNNLTGTLVMKRKLTEFKYDFWINGYTKKVTLLEKLKPKTDDGSKMTLVTYVEDDKTGDLLVLAAIKYKLFGKNTAPRPADLHFMRYNKDFDLLSDNVIPFEKMQGLAGSKIMYEKNGDDPENPGVSSFRVLLRSYEADGSAPTITYLNLSADTKITSREEFKSNAIFWNIDEIVYNEDKDELFAFGPAVDKASKAAAGKFKSVQLVKFNSQGKVEYLTETELPEFAAKLKTPPSQKKSPEYEGKKFEFATYKVTSSGDFLVSGQNYKIDKSGDDQGTKNYKDVIGFHFDGKGKLKSQYGIDTKENGKEANDNGTPQQFIEGRDGNVFWLLREIKGYSSFGNGKLLTYPRLGKISPDGTISDFVTFGKNDGYYLDSKFPYLETDKGNRVVFFGSSKSGKSLSFIKVKLK